MQNLVILFAGLAVAFGCLWHNRPSRAGTEDEGTTRDDQPKELRHSADQRHDSDR